ncbi:MAG: hypothetical protein EPN62_13010 [Candidimonas sp.]|nr:MAG: hypothetical protein EPN77_06600 [Candidimonas sp.]TAM21944.1 MAG: hypothetical protein EPN62_13010 [Candidimonas sp.]
MRRAALILTVIWFIVGGIAHFVATGAFAGIVPSYVPLPRIVVYVSGALELLGAMGMCLPKWRRSAAWCLILLTILVTPANVGMLLHAAQYPHIPVWALIARLPLQVLLLLIIALAGGLIGRGEPPMR